MSVPDPANTKWIPLWNTGATQGAGAGLITGDLVWSVLATRTGAVSCDGTLYNSVVDNTFAALYAAIGITYGGSGPTSFAVPDVRGRLLICRGTNADVNAVGKNDGDANPANRTPLHWHQAGGGLVFTGSFAGYAGGTGVDSPDHAHYIDGDTGYVSADHAHWVPVNLDGSTSGNFGAFVGTDHGAWVNVWTSGIGTNHTHHYNSWSGGASARHAHAFTPGGAVSGSISGSIGASGARPADTPSYIVENCFIVK